MIRVVVDDLAFVAADAIVRPATTRLEPTTASLRNLEQVGGPAFWNQLNVREDLAVGSAVVTGAGELAAGLVIHAIISGPAEPVTADGVRRALQSAFERAKEWEAAHVALPPIGVGPGQLSLEDGAYIVAESLHVTQGTAALPLDVTIVVDSAEDRSIFEARLHPDSRESES